MNSNHLKTTASNTSKLTWHDISFDSKTQHLAHLVTVALIFSQLNPSVLGAKGIKYVVSCTWLEEVNRSGLTVVTDIVSESAGLQTSLSY